MSDLYTSYSTSVALRDAGAPQTALCEPWWYIDEDGDQYVSDVAGGRHVARAWRADEIIEAIRADGVHTVDIEDDDKWGVRVWRDGDCPKLHEHESLVEALAAAWLAVLKEAHRG